MALNLNTSREAYRGFPEEGTAPNVEQMPLLIADGRIPISTAVLMQRRLDVRNSDDKVQSAWMDNYFDTGDGVVYHPDGRVKIVLESEDLRNMTPDTPKNGGALIITPEAYDVLGGEEFKKGKLGKMGNCMSKADVKAHPVWKVLARDQGLLDDYADYIAAEYKARFSKDTPIEDIGAMGVFTSSARGDTPEMRAWFVGGLGDRSGVNGWYGLDYNYGRLVGIAPEALGAPGRGASNIKAYTMADLQAYDSAVKGLESTVKPELLKPFAELRKKL